MGRLLPRRQVLLHIRVTDIDERRLDWIKSPLPKRKAHIELLLESLEHKDAEVRFTNARRLLYILQGNRMIGNLEVLVQRLNQ
jgi:N1221-like protein